jgi:hypothetical protein
LAVVVAIMMLAYCQCALAAMPYLPLSLLLRSLLGLRFGSIPVALISARH